MNPQQILRRKAMDSKPTYEQAQLHLQVYEQRREPRLRQARDWFAQNYFPETFDDAMKIAAPGTEGGINFGMVTGYWEQACALLNYGLLHDDLFFETSGEFFMVWDRLRHVVAEGREKFVYKQFLAHVEQAAQRYETWIEKRSPGHIAAMRQFMKMMRPPASKAA